VLYAKDSLKVYGEYRKKARELVADLKTQGVESVYIDDDDEAMDILRLTCIEAGISISAKPQRGTLNSIGKDFRALVNSRIDKAR
jgi:hypothetical protein